MNLLVFVSTLEGGGVANTVLSQVKACLALTSDLHVDFACSTPLSNTKQECLEKIGARVYPVVPFSNNPIEYCRTSKRAIEESGCDAVHTHLGHLNWVVCKIAQKCGIERRVMHSHSELPRSTSLPFRVAMRLAPPLNRRYSTKMFACSQAAGRAYFGRGFEFLPNFVEPSCEGRSKEAMREEYDAEFNYHSARGVRVGFLGALDKNKRPEFAVEISRALGRAGCQHLMLIAGDGPRRAEIEEMALGSPSIHVLGQRKDARCLLQYLDYLVLPSIVEGMSLSALEAQMSGTMCIASDTIASTHDLGLGLFEQLDCGDAGNWASEIMEHGTNYPAPSEDEIMRRIVAIGYDSKTVAKRLLEAYGMD